MPAIDARGHHLLADRRRDRTRFCFLNDLGQHDEQAREALLARIEQLIDEVRLDLAVAQLGDEKADAKPATRHQR